MTETKRINISISEKEYEVLSEMAESNGLKPTTLAMLMVKKDIKRFKGKTNQFNIFD